MINNRQAGRRRGRSGNPGGGGGGSGGPRQGGGGRSDNGNRIDSRARGNAAQLLEKYKNLASDAQRQGDRVNTEYYLQFADHYFRVLADQRGRFEDQQPRRPQADFDGDGDEDCGDEGEPIRANEQAEPRYEQQQRPERYEGRAERPDRSEQRPERAERSEQQRPERQQQARRPEGGRAEGERPRRWEGERPDRRPDEIAGQRRADLIAPGENLEARAEAVLEADAPLHTDVAPRRRGRPRREAVEASVEVSERPRTAEADGGGGEGAEFNGVDADRLPPSLGQSIGGGANDVDNDVPRPRRRRVRPEASAG